MCLVGWGTAANVCGLVHFGEWDPGCAGSSTGGTSGSLDRYDCGYDSWV